MLSRSRPTSRSCLAAAAKSPSGASISRRVSGTSESAALSRSAALQSVCRHSRRKPGRRIRLELASIAPDAILGS
eukprot:scaffold18527_cov90-Isochrysis_galbana.AAC.3